MLGGFCVLVFDNALKAKLLKRIVGRGRAEMVISPKRAFKRLLLTSLPDNILQAIKKLYYPRKIKSFSENDEIDLIVFKHLVNPGDCVVDIGACIGAYTKFLSELVGDQGRVYSIEPIHLTFELLCSNVNKLGLNNVELINCAVSDTEGIGTMEVPLWDDGGENFYRSRIVDTNVDSSLRKVKVKVNRLDSILSNLHSRISFIKCDVEGHELPLIKGAITTIRKSKPAWCIEISGNPDDSRSSAYTVFELLNDKGYEPYWFDGTKINKRCSGDKSTNYFFLSLRHIQRLPASLITPNVQLK